MEAIAGYHLKTTLGEGGMARVYLGTQDSLDRAVAIKVLNASLIKDPIIQTQFAQESKLIARLNHPNIVQVIDQGTTESGLPFFAMPYVKSVALGAITKRTDINATRKIDICIQICKALAYAHRNGVVHRDIKPDNILVDYEGHVRLVDFGIAGFFETKKNQQNESTNRLESANDLENDMIMGTDAYMAPEQADGINKTTQLSDLYSLGVVMHQLFFGELPFLAKATSPFNNQNNPDRELLESIKPLIFKCLEPTPEKRPVNADEVRQQLLVIGQGKHLSSHQWSNDSPQDAIPANYKLLDVLKENPFGATYLVKDPKLQRFMVIKKQRVDHLGNAQLVNAKLTHVQHPHIARIFGTGKNQRVFILVSEYLAAGSLQERLSQALTLGQWILMAQQLCAALACAHSHGIVHGNLRPSNILFAENNFIKVSDFGFPPHSYAEADDWYRAENEDASMNADVYAAGAILFQLLSGVLPKKSFLNWRNRWALRHIGKSLRKILLQMTHHSRPKRFANADLAMQAFQDYYNQQNTKMAEKLLIKR